MLRVNYYCGYLGDVSRRDEFGEVDCGRGGRRLGISEERDGRGTFHADGQREKRCMAGAVARSAEVVVDGGFVDRADDMPLFGGRNVTDAMGTVPIVRPVPGLGARAPSRRRDTHEDKYHEKRHGFYERRSVHCPLIGGYFRKTGRFVHNSFELVDHHFS